MSGFGERLKRERESHNTSIEEIAAASGIGQSYLQALEQDDFPSLPGPAFGKLYIRAYAEVLGFDPQPWIDDYDREQRAAMAASAEPPAPEPARPRRVGDAVARWREARINERNPQQPEIAVTEAPAEAPNEIQVERFPEPPQPERVPDAAPRSRRPVGVLVVAGVLAGAAVIYLGVFRRDAEERPPTPSVHAEPPPVASASEPPPVQAAEPHSPPRPAKPVAGPTTAPALVVTESGVGRRIVNFRLEDEGDTFPQGSRVSFSSRVRGGRSGAIIRHVWLFDGKIEQSIPLRLGGADWRTHSTKTIGRTGAWAVEVRDDAGRVLARTSFTCTPAVP
jgi:transcriptional regulator with XRE-family HTH domain